MDKNNIKQNFNWKLFWFQFFTAINLISIFSFISVVFFPVLYLNSALAYFFPFDQNNFLPAFVAGFYVYCLIVSFGVFFRQKNQDRGVLVASFPFIVNLAAYFLFQVF